MLMHLHATALVPCSEHDATLSAVVVDVLETLYDVRHPAEAPSETAESKCPCTIDIGRLAGFLVWDTGIQGLDGGGHVRR